MSSGRVFRKTSRGEVCRADGKTDIGKIGDFYIFLQLVRKTALIFEKKYIIIGV